MGDSATLALDVGYRFVFEHTWLGLVLTAESCSV
jgi:hypothetical protein